MASGGGSPCGACKFLRRRCEKDCIFAPHFSSDEGAAQFAAIHRVFGASNVSKLLRHRVPPPDRGDAVATVAYEAQARLGDPVYGCVAHIAALQSQVAGLQMQLLQLKGRLVAAQHARRAGNIYCDVREEEYAFADHPRDEHSYNYPQQQTLIPACGDHQYPTSSGVMMSPRSCSSIGVVEQEAEEGPSDLVLLQANEMMGSELHALALRMMRK